MKKKEVFVIVTCLYNNDDVPEYQCCNCNHKFDHKHLINNEGTEYCPGCNHKVGQIEVL